MQKQASFYSTALLCLLTSVLVKIVQGAKPNIIIYMTDDQGFAIMPGNTQINLPNLEKFVTQGKILKRTYTASLCAPSRWSAYTGDNQILANGFDGTIPVPNITLPKAMRDMGYSTAIIGKYGFGNNKTVSSADNMGFQYSYIYPTHVDAHITFPVSLEENGRKIIFQQNRKSTVAKCLNSNRCAYGPDLFYSKAIQYIRDQAAVKNPFFLVWTPNVPHVGKFTTNLKKITCPVPTYSGYSKQKWSVSQKGFASMMTNYIDRDIGGLMNLLENLGLSNNTYIMYYSDNGGEGSLLNINKRFMANAPLKSGKGSQYDGGIRVPAVIWGPGRIQAGSSSNYFFHTQNLLPTITELAGHKITTATASSSIASIWLHGDPEAVSSSIKPIYIELCPDNISSNRCTYAFISLKEWPNRVLKMLNSGRGTEVYDLAVDPGETQNLFKEPHLNNSIADLEKEKTELRLLRPRL
jgi:arylsulfatase A-like enzyme